MYFVSQLTTSMLRWIAIYCIMNSVKKDTEENTLVTSSKVHFNIINGVNCK